MTYQGHVRNGIVLLDNGATLPEGAELLSAVVDGAVTLFLFVRDFARRELGALWRSYWTLAFAAYAFHLWYGFGVMFRGDWAAVTASQGQNENNHG